MSEGTSPSLVSQVLISIFVLFSTQLSLWLSFIGCLTLYDPSTGIFPRFFAFVVRMCADVVRFASHSSAFSVLKGHYLMTRFHTVPHFVIQVVMR